ncbi:unnamed protein product [Adineta steineri]|uniref:G-protein coupled receptors family 1 profile domain-containing protein n=1 Tax=Adineta steineri TaxID=433720 RepID=A0A818X269_9BILA|nr:unnamed protein product [Adineta steineri]CAF3732838.1 unnamed protein product [Adineta steineri]
MSVATINNIRLQLGHCVIPILLALGNFGNLFTTWILIRTLKQRTNSCALYLLCASLANWFVINTVLISSLYGLDYVEPIHISNILCKLRWYGAHVLFIASRNFLIAACVDRWALCSQNIKIRSFSQSKIALRVVFFIIIGSILMAIPLLFFFNNSSGRCAINPSYNLAYTSYSLTFIAILPPSLMILFSFLARHNLTMIRSRVKLIDGDKTRDIHIHKRDHDLIKMLFGEVVMFCLTTCPFPCITLYNFLTVPITSNKTPIRVAIESFINFIIQPLLNYTYCCTQFYGGGGDDYDSGDYDSGDYGNSDYDSDVDYSDIEGLDVFIYGLLVVIHGLLVAIYDLLVVIFDNEIIVFYGNQFVIILSENYTVIISLICTISLAIYIIVLIRNWVLSDDTSQPSDVTFVYGVRSTSNKINVENLNSLFITGQWTSRYFQYKQWHGPHLFSLSFNRRQLKVTGLGKDNIGEFSIDGIYSLNTRRIALTKKYQKGTGDSSQNLGHTVNIQLEWNLKERLFDGKWYVTTEKYQGQGKFELQFDQSTIVVDKR